MDEIILKYKAKVYEDKISRLQGYDSNLDTLLDQLIAKKGEISSFWTGDEAEEFTQKINTEIERVKAASRTVKDLTRQYEQTMEDYKRMSGFVGDVIGGLEGVVTKDIKSDVQSYL